MASRLVRRFAAAVMVVVAAGAACVQAAAAAAEPRIAVVIGNNAYPVGPLLNPVNDARLMAETLTALGFDVDLRLDVDLDGLKEAIRDFGRRLEAAGGDAVALFYYAGHGLQVRGENYLVPVDAAIGSERDVDYMTFPASWLVRELERTPTGLNILILDACRDNPFQRGLRSLARGLAEMRAGLPQTLIAFSTAPDTQALDGTGGNSPYTEALAEAMRQPGLPVEQVFKETRRRVQAATGGQQTPWEHTSLTVDFTFAPEPPAVAADPAAPPAPAPASGGTQPAVFAPADPCAREDLLWAAIKGSGDAEAFREFIKNFPACEHADEAARRMAVLLAAPKRQRVVAVREPRIDIYAEYRGDNWCDPSTTIRMEAEEASVYQSSRFKEYIPAIADRIGVECPVLAESAYTGYVRGADGPVHSGHLRP